MYPTASRQELAISAPNKFKFCDSSIQTDVQRTQLKLGNKWNPHSSIKRKVENIIQGYEANKNIEKAKCIIPVLLLHDVLLPDALLPDSNYSSITIVNVYIYIMLSHRTHEVNKGKQTKASDLPTSEISST